MHRGARARGFTLIELLIVVAIIGIIAALLIPNLLDSIQKAKQKRTMAEQKLVGTAMMSWLTDRAGGAAAAGLPATVEMGDVPDLTTAELENELVPQYLQELDDRDGWGHTIEYRLNVANPNAVTVMSIRSTGRDGVFAGDTYSTGAFDPTDYDQDLVWLDGFFVRWPERSADEG